MRLDCAILAASLLGHVSAGVVDAARPDTSLIAIPQPEVRDSQSEQNDLFKRKGGGGGGGRGGGGGSIGGGRSGSSGGSTGAGSRPNTGAGSNLGGSSRGGSGVRPAFAGGRFYGGGAATPFRAGRVSPLGIAPLFLVGAAALAFWPGVWLYGAHLYPYNYVHRFHNATTDKDETIRVACACAQFAECGCDENNSTAYYNDLIGNGSYEALNKSVVNVGQFRGQKTLLINGTLPNGTTSDGPDQNGEGSAAAGVKHMLETAGFWPVIAAVVATVCLA